MLVGSVSLPCSRQSSLNAMENEILALIEASRGSESWRQVSEVQDPSAMSGGI